MNPTGGGVAPLACPNCGAPAQVQPGQTLVTCPYCQRSFELPAAAPPPQIVERVVVVEPAALSPATAGVAPRRRASGCGLVAFVPLLGMAIAGYAVYHAVNPTAALPGAVSALVHPWDGSSPLVCGGDQRIEAHDVRAIFATGTAIDAGGDCHVTCTHCTLQAPVAISAGGDAQIVLVDSRVEGSTQAIVAGGDATVKVTGESSVTGAVVKGGDAQVVVPPRAPAPHAYPARRPAR